MTIRILIADDHRLMRQGLREICEVRGGFEVVGEAANGREAVDMAVRLRPDVVLMDVAMPVLDGPAATCEILQRLPSARVIMLTIHQEDRYVFEAIKAGARGYLLKDADWQELVAAVRSVVHGEALLSPALAARVLDEFRRMKQVPQAEVEPEALTPSEMDVLLLVAQGADNKTIMERLHLSEKSVTNRLAAVYSKLRVTNRTQAALVALRRGWASLDE